MNSNEDTLPFNREPPPDPILILVDPYDRQIGELGSLLVHRYAMLHRAFSVFIFREREGVLELLLQQRSLSKNLGAGLWTNTCCSHPRPGEQLREAAENRLVVEMGIRADLDEVGSFHYTASFDNGFTENEIDHVFVGTYDPLQDIAINREEVEQSHWEEVEALKKALSTQPKKYTPWFKRALELALANSTGSV